MAWNESNKFGTDYSLIPPEDLKGDHQEEYSMWMHGYTKRRESGWVINLPKEVVDYVVNPVTNPTNKNLMRDLTTAENVEQKEWEKIERRLCTIKKIYHYPIIWTWKKIRGYWIILKPDELKSNEHKDFIISYAYDDENHPKFRAWEKVWYVNNWMKTEIVRKKMHGYTKRRESGWVINLPKEVVDYVVNPVTNPTNKNLMRDLTTAENVEQKEWEKIERRLCTIKKIYHYPIIWTWKKIRGYWIILKPDELKSNEHKDFIISYAYDDENHPKFRAWEKVWYVNNWMKTEIVRKNRKK